MYLREIFLKFEKLKKDGECFVCGKTMKRAHPGKRPGIVLIIKSEKDRKYWIRLNSIIQHYGLLIDTWEVK